MLERLRRQSPADIVLTADDAPRGFPFPDLVLTAMLRTEANDVQEVAVVSATDAGVLAGRRAGARIVAGVGAGARRIAALYKAGATHVLDNVAALPDLLISAA
jgi:beta-phosphoglucomutase-like phosphatase (HAD superfamily)